MLDLLSLEEEEGASIRKNPVTHLQFVFVLLVDPGQQLGLASVQGVDEGVALRHQTGLELHAVLLRHNRQTLGQSRHCQGAGHLKGSANPKKV